MSLETFESNYVAAYRVLVNLLSEISTIILFEAIVVLKIEKDEQKAVFVWRMKSELRASAYDRSRNRGSDDLLSIILCWNSAFTPTLLNPSD